MSEYKKSKVNKTGWSGFDSGAGIGAADVTDHLGNGNYGYIEISNLRKNQGVLKFKAFVTDFSDNFESNWNSTEVFGRMDPIWTYQNTKRVISLGFDVPSFGVKEGKKNMEKISAIAKMMYPTYEGAGGVSVIQESPIFTLKFGNLICNNKGGGPLKGVIPSFNFAPDIEQGWYTQGSMELYPKTVKISFDFNVLHDHSVGYDVMGNFGGTQGKFPYMGNGGLDKEAKSAGKGNNKVAKKVDKNAKAKALKG